MPVDAFLQEAENLSKWVLDDQKELKTVDITVEMINDLPVRAGALRELQHPTFRAAWPQLPKEAPPLLPSFAP